MLDRLFDPEGPVITFIFKVKDLIILNIITLVFMLPIVTIGPALKALAFTCLKMVREEDGNVIKTFVKNFKLNFKQTFLFGLVCLLMIAIGAGDILALIFYRKVFSAMLTIPAIVSLVIIAAVLVYAIPMQGRFLNPIGTTFKNAFWATLLKPLRTLLMLLSWLIFPFLIYFVSGNFIALLFALGLALPAYLNALLYEPLFRKIENKINGVEEDENAEDD